LSKKEERDKILFYDYLLRTINEESSTDTPKITLDVLKKQSRKFNIDLTPKVNMNKNFYL
jgi:hypothetical protein